MYFVFEDLWQVVSCKVVVLLHCAACTDNKFLLFYWVCTECIGDQQVGNALGNVQDLCMIVLKYQQCSVLPITISIIRKSFYDIMPKVLTCYHSQNGPI